MIKNSKIQDPLSVRLIYNFHNPSPHPITKINFNHDDKIYKNNFYNIYKIFITLTYKIIFNKIYTNIIKFYKII